MGLGELHVLSLSARTAVRTIALPGVEEVRAVVWSPHDRRVYLADSGKETVWSVSVPPLDEHVERIAGPGAFLEPAGLTVASDGTLWMVDQRARAAVQLSGPTRGILRRVPLANR